MAGNKTNFFALLPGARVVIVTDYCDWDILPLAFLVLLAFSEFLGRSDLEPFKLEPQT